MLISITPLGHICRWEKILTSILQIQSLRYSTNYTTHPYCGTYGFEPPVIGSFSLFHPVSIRTQLALSPIYFVDLTGFQPALCLRCYMKCASLLRCHSFSVLPQSYRAIFQITELTPQYLLFNCCFLHR